ncbi:hypothetical protein BKA62DRAFT_388741 [Auriculariales sp. MPI-PUGE-AT-0066]|nr:hypothetical protein BKA62DRAFT_388741 [Auriculariales sp. MPI-PUGE-AT-0066]
MPTTRAANSAAAAAVTLPLTPPSSGKGRGKGRVLKALVPKVSPLSYNDTNTSSWMVPHITPTKRQLSVGRASVQDVVEGEALYGSGGKDRSARKARPNASVMRALAARHGSGDHNSDDDTFVEEGADDVGRVDDIASEESSDEADQLPPSPTPSPRRATRKLTPRAFLPALTERRRSGRLAAKVVAENEALDASGILIDGASATDDETAVPSPPRRFRKLRAAGKQPEPLKLRGRGAAKNKHIEDGGEVYIKQEPMSDDDFRVRVAPGGFPVSVSDAETLDSETEVERVHTPPVTDKTQTDTAKPSIVDRISSVILIGILALLIMDASWKAADFVITCFFEVTGYGAELTDFMYDVYMQLGRTGLETQRRLEFGHVWIDSTLVPFIEALLHCSLVVMRLAALHMNNLTIVATLVVLFKVYRWMSRVALSH